MPSFSSRDGGKLPVTFGWGERQPRRRERAVGRRGEGAEMSACSSPFMLSLLFFFFFVFLGLHSWHIRGSQARGQIRAVATGHSHNTAGSEPCL